MKSGRARWQKAEETRKDFNTVLIHQDEEFCTSELFKVIHSGRNLIDPSLQDNVLIPNDFFEYIYHIGCAINLHSIVRHAQYLHKAWKKHQDAVYWVDINLAIAKGLKFYQTRSNAIILQETLPAYCIPKVVTMEIWRSHIRESICVTSTSSKDFL